MASHNGNIFAKASASPLSVSRSSVKCALVRDPVITATDHGSSPVQNHSPFWNSSPFSHSSSSSPPIAKRSSAQFNNVSVGLLALFPRPSNCKEFGKESQWRLHTLGQGGNGMNTAESRKSVPPGSSVVPAGSVFQKVPASFS